MNLADKINFLYLLVAGGVLHGIADWFFQNEWMAVNKAKRREREGEVVGTTWSGGLVSFVPPTRWWDRHPAAYVHAGIHTMIQLLIFPVWAALIIGILHLIIDTRSPLEWWGKFTRQTRTRGHVVEASYEPCDRTATMVPLYDIGMEVAFWRDQVAHIAVLAGVALLCV